MCLSKQRMMERMAVGPARRSGAPSCKPPPSSRRARARRVQLFLLVRSLLQYLERVDPAMLTVAKEVLKDCERHRATNPSRYPSLADAISVELRKAVGEDIWNTARAVAKKLLIRQSEREGRGNNDGGDE